jgi:hypothetical protein
MWKVVDFFDKNPNASIIEAASFFEEELEIKKQTTALKDESRIIANARMQIRPLYAKKKDIEEQMMFIISTNIDVEVFVKYPPRKGSKEERDKYRDELKQANVEYQELTKQLKDVNIQLEELNDEMSNAERDAKNARRLTEIFNGYMQLIMAYRNVPIPVTQTQTASAPVSGNRELF